MQITLSRFFNGDGSAKHLEIMQDARRWQIEQGKAAIARHNLLYAQMCRRQALYWTEQIYMHLQGFKPGQMVKGNNR